MFFKNLLFFYLRRLNHSRKKFEVIENDNIFLFELFFFNIFYILLYYFIVIIDRIFFL